MPEKTKSMCSGCHDDYYNHNQPEGCWHFAIAKVVERMKVGIWQNPPYTWRPRETLSCHSPEGCVWIKQDDPRIVKDEHPHVEITVSQLEETNDETNE